MNATAVGSRPVAPIATAAAKITAAATDSNAPALRSGHDMAVRLSFTLHPP
jgi:hypothetical protein